jgi:hypothetical protein
VKARAATRAMREVNCIVGLKMWGFEKRTLGLVVDGSGKEEEGVYLCKLY